MIEPVKLLSAAETAAILRDKCGRARAWGDFLADCIRDRTSLHGHVLMPFAALTSKDGTVARPLYRPQDVVDFIRLVRLADPAIKPMPFTSERFTVETSPALPWRMRTAQRVKHGGARSL